MDGSLIDLLAQIAVVEAGQEWLLRGIDDDDSIGSLSSPTLGILGTLGHIGLAETG